MTIDEKLETFGVSDDWLSSSEKIEESFKKGIKNKVSSAEKKIKKLVLEEVKKHIDVKLVKKNKALWMWIKKQ